MHRLMVVMGFARRLAVTGVATPWRAPLRRRRLNRAAFSPFGGRRRSGALQLSHGAVAALSATFLLFAGCGSDDDPPAPVPTATPARLASATAAPPSATPAVPTATAVASPTAVDPAPTATPTVNPLSYAIVFTPAVVYLHSPAEPAAPGDPASLSIELAAYDGAGLPLVPTAERPITISVYGAPDGVISPGALELTGGAVATFEYSGAYVANPITITASMPAGDGGQALGVAQILPTQAVACTYGSTSYRVPLLCADGESDEECAANNVASGLRVQASVGYDAPRPEDFQAFTIDTGSLGVIVPVAALGPDAIGPGAVGVKSYDSSGNTFAGRYYLAPVTLEAEDGAVVRTSPVKVLAITSAYCAPDSKCTKQPHPPEPTLHYLGIGFDRNATGSGDLFNSPADNAALHVVDGTNGTDVSPGYVLSGSALTLGIVSTAGYDLAPLTPNGTVPGDWNAAPGCFGFPALPAPNQFCGSLLLDVGIPEMFLQLPPAQRPPGSADASNQVPRGTEMQILAGTAANPAMSYAYTLSESPPPNSPQPSYIDWSDLPGTFVNTGRHPLYAFDYLYDARCGHVGFAPLP